MGCSDRHIAMEVGQHDVAPRVQVLSAKLHNPLLLVFPPANPTAFVVELIGRGIDIAKIAQSVIKRIAVDVVDNVRLLVVSKKPSNAVGKIALALNEDDAVSGATFDRASYGASNTIAAPNFIGDDSSFGVIAKAFTDRIRNNFVSHAENLLSVVRGLVVGATSTPIIPMASNIGKEFAPSGGKSRGTYGTTLCSTIRQPL